MASTADNGIVNKPGSRSVDQAVEKLEAMLRAKGVALFTLVDLSGEAEKAGMKMRPSKLLIFGNPKAGNPLMLAAPIAATHAIRLSRQKTTFSRHTPGGNRGGKYHDE
jgi:uncharacterized protein (DUF302 family)